MSTFSESFNARRSKKRRGVPQDQQIASLRAEQQQFGAPAIEADKPSLFMRVVDLLSRPNYAIAGAADELLQGAGVAKAFARGVNELLSGVPGLTGQKEAWGKVLEDAGMGTVTLADVFPVMDGTWVGRIGSRGTVGLALDVLTDPLTYMTAGTSAAGRITLKGVQRFLNPKGIEEFGTLMKQLAPKFDNIEDATERVLKLKEAASDEFLRKFGTAAGDLAEEVTDVGGIRFFGRTIASSDAIRRVTKDPIVRALQATPGGKQALEGAATMYAGMRKTINGIFHPFNELGNLPPELRPLAMDLARDFHNASAMHRGRIRGLLDSGGEFEVAGQKVTIRENLARRYQQAAKSDELLGQKFYSIREAAVDPSTGKKYSLSDLSPEAREVYDEFVHLSNFMRDTIVGAGVLDGKAVRVNYFPHFYKNPTEDILQSHFHDLTPIPVGAGENFLKERVFDTYADSVLTSKNLNEIEARRIAAGKTAPPYPVLEPDYDLLSNFNRYIDRYGESLARQAWHEQVFAQFGKEIASFDPSDIYRLTRGIPVDGVEAKAINEFFGDSKKFKDLVEEVTGEDITKATRGALEDETLGEAAKVLRGLSDDGKREFMQQMVLRAKSSSQLASMLNHLVGEFGDFMPAFRLADGQVEGSLAKLFGNDALYVPVKSKFTGQNGVMLPKIILDDLLNIRSQVINTRDYKGFGKLIKGFDTVNNIFKLGVYTFWPASAVRDAYSNVALSMLDIGIGAIDPKMHAASVGIMRGIGGKLKTKQGLIYDYADLRKMARDFGVWVPGETFAELTGDAAKSVGRVQRGLKKAANVRGLIENEARIQLWINNIRRGVDPRTAADHVAEFLFNYGELNKVEREVFRRFIPFYTFTRKNIQLQAKAITKTPGLVINQVKPFRPRDDEQEMMVKWEAGALGIRLDRDGKTVHALQGIDLPLRNLDTLWSGTLTGSARRILGMVTPVLKTPLLEVAAGRDLFTGNELTRSSGPTIGRIIEMTGTPKPVRDWLGYKKEYDEAGRPKYTFDGLRYSMLVRSWAFSRVFSTSDRQFREYLSEGDFDTQAALWDFFTGIRPKDLNLDEQLEMKRSRIIRQLEQSLARRGRRGTFRRQFTPKEIDEAEF